MAVIKQTIYTVSGTTLQVIPCMDKEGYVKVMHNGSELFKVKYSAAESLADALHDAVYDAQEYINAQEEE